MRPSWIINPISPLASPTWASGTTSGTRPANGPRAMFEVSWRIDEEDDQVAERRRQPKGHQRALLHVRPPNRMNGSPPTPPGNRRNR